MVARPLVVNSTGDTADVAPQDAVCDTGGTIVRGAAPEPECTLRAALQTANARGGADTITFDIPGQGAPVIRPGTALPPVTESLVLDGASQPAAGKVTVDGAGAGVTAVGLEFTAGEHRVRNLVVQNFGSHGVLSSSPGRLRLEAVEVTGNGGWGVLSKGDVAVNFDPVSGDRIGQAFARFAGNKGGGGVFSQEGRVDAYFTEATGNRGPGLAARRDIILGAIKASNNSQGPGVQSILGNITMLEWVGSANQVSDNAGPGIYAGSLLLGFRNIGSGGVAYRAITVAGALEVRNNGAWGLLAEAGDIRINWNLEEAGPVPASRISGNGDPSKEVFILGYEGTPQKIARTGAEAGGIGAERGRIDGRRLEVTDNWGPGLVGDDGITVMGLKANNNRGPGVQSRLGRIDIGADPAFPNEASGNAGPGLYAGSLRLFFEGIGEGGAADDRIVVENAVQVQNNAAWSIFAERGHVKINDSGVAEVSRISGNGDPSKPIFVVGSEGGVEQVARTGAEAGGIGAERGNIRAQRVAAVANRGDGLAAVGAAAAADLRLVEVLGNQGTGVKVTGALTIATGEICRNSGGDLVAGGQQALTGVVYGAGCLGSGSLAAQVEDGAPNGGDGNHDGIPDSLQARVASLPTSSQGRYVTLDAPVGTALAEVRARPNPAPERAPAAVVFPVGFLDFTVAGLKADSAATVTLFLPEGTSANTYWLYGSTVDNPAPHWYEFTYDGVTGAQVQGNKVLLHFKDGARGDGDLAANGVIVDPGAPACSGCADLGVVGSEGSDAGTIGQGLAYSWTVSNHGAVEATGVTLSVALPAGVTVPSATAGQGRCAVAAATVTCGLGPLARGASATIALVVTPSVAGTLVTVATVTGNEVDADGRNNTATVVTTVTASPPPTGGSGGGASPGPPPGPPPPPSATGAVGATVGGSVSLEGITVTVPPGVTEGATALTVQVTAAAVPPTAPAIEGFLPGSRAFTVSLRDAQGATLTQLVRGLALVVPYTEADLRWAGGDPSRLHLYRYDEAAGAWQALETAVDTGARTLKATSLKTSLFALMVELATPSNLVGPVGGVMFGLGATLAWTNPPDTAQFQIQVLPFNHDGPAINMVIGRADLVQAARFQVPSPVFGQGNYIMLPGMSYTWRVRTSPLTTALTETDWGWSKYVSGSFRTFSPTSATITPVSVSAGGVVGSLTPTLQWADANSSIFYYEVQLSADAAFNVDPATAIAPVYWELVHGGVTSPPNSYTVDAAFKLAPGTVYYWRVRPRVQGDGMPVEWSDTWRFTTPGG